MNFTAKLISLFSILLIISSCAVPRTVNFDQDLFEKNYSKWKNQNNTNYNFIYNSMGFMSYSTKVVVENNKVIKSNYIDFNTSKIDEDTSCDETRTIDSHFENILYFYNSNNGQEYSDNEMYYTDIIVEYNETYGYPEKWCYKYYCPENLAVDGNFYNEITDLDLSDDQNL